MLTYPAATSLSLVSFYWRNLSRQWPPLPFKMKTRCRKCLWQTTNTVKTQRETAAIVFFAWLRQHDVFQQRHVAGWHLNICPITPVSAKVWQYITFKFFLLTHIAFMQLPDIFHTTMEALFFLSPSQTPADRSSEPAEWQNMLQYRKYNPSKLHLLVFWVFIFFNLWSGCWLSLD